MSRVLLYVLIAVTLLAAKPLPEGKVLNYHVDNFAMDVLGNLYVIHETELRKYDKHFEELANFSNLSYGNITSVDASDAMNLLVFYEDFAKVLFLDNTLSLKKSAIDLNALGFPNASLACLSYNNAFWIFDPVNQELVRISQFLEIGDRSGNLNQVIHTEILPDQLFESGNRVYLKDNKEGIFIFDRYAGFIKRLPFVNVQQIAVYKQDELSYLRNDTLFVYDMRTLQTDTINFRLRDLKKVHFNGDRAFLLTEKGLLQSVPLAD
jgi:hypothetical protein